LPGAKHINMEKTTDLKKTSDTVSKRCRIKKDRPIIQFGTLAQAREHLKNAVFAAELRPLFPPDCGLKFSDDPIKEDSQEKTK
jgi:hypothetical protein